MGARARACGRGSPRSPAERGARGGRQLSLALSCEASSAPGVRSASDSPAGVRRAPDHPGSQHWQNRAPEACFCCGRLRGRGGGRQGRPHANLGTCSQSARRSSPRESPTGLELRRAKESPVSSRPPRRPVEADLAVPPQPQRRRERPPASGAHGGVKARIGGWLEAGAPAEARAAVLRAETTLSARSRVSGAAEESIIQIFVTASSSPSASRWVQQSPSTHRRADTHTPQNLLQCFSLCLATPEQEPTPLISGSQNPKTKDSSISSTWLLSCFLSYTKPKSP